MRSVLRRLAVAVPFAFLPVAPRPAVRHTPEGDLRALNSSFIHAVFARDSATLDTLILAPDFSFIGSNGAVLDRAAYLAASVDPAYSKYRHLDADQVVVRVWGDAAIVNARTTWTLVRDGKDVSGHARFTDVYIRRNGRWQVVEAHLSRVVE